ncbi:MAG: PqiC family protein, partial [Desulfobacterales bacterium]
MTPFIRCLPAIASIVGIFLGGCLGKSPSTRFYALTPMPDDQTMLIRESTARKTFVGIGPIKLADYLDQSKLVTRAGDNRMVVADYDQWAGSFENNFIHALAENIGFLVPTDRVSIYPWRTSVPIDYQVLLDVVRCDGQLGKDALLVARWSILKGQDKELLATSRSSIREPVTGSDY